MIELKNVTLQTRHLLLNNVSYVFEPYKIYGIVAENGSGKTTLFRSMVQLIKIQSGEIVFDHRLADKSLRKIFYFENIEWLDKNLSGMDYLKFVKSMWKSGLDIQDVIKEWKMEDYIHIPIKKYSLGMKQRLMIAMYIISDAKYMIMDEITNGLDEDNRKLFFHSICQLTHSGKTILISSHYKEEIMGYCDVVLQIKNYQLKEITS